MNPEQPSPEGKRRQNDPQQRSASRPERHYDHVPTLSFCCFDIIDKVLNQQPTFANPKIRSRCINRLRKAVENLSGVLSHIPEGTFDQIKITLCKTQDKEDANQTHVNLVRVLISEIRKSADSYIPPGSRRAELNEQLKKLEDLLIPLHHSYKQSTAQIVSNASDKCSLEVLFAREMDLPRGLSLLTKAALDLLGSEARPYSAVVLLREDWREFLLSEREDNSPSQYDYRGEYCFDDDDFPCDALSALEQTLVFENPKQCGVKLYQQPHEWVANTDSEEASQYFGRVRLLRVPLHHATQHLGTQYLGELFVSFERTQVPGDDWLPRAQDLGKALCRLITNAAKIPAYDGEEEDS